jgi:hypothetical protein
LGDALSALRFFFRTTLRRYDIIEHTAFVHAPRKLPVVLSPKAVARLLDAAPGLCSGSSRRRRSGPNDRLRSLDLDELRTLWRVTFRSSPPPAFTKDLMARFLCWHIQEQAQVV